MKSLIPFALAVVLTITFASCSKPKPESNPEESDSIAKIVNEEAHPIIKDGTEKPELPKKGSAQSAFPQITSFTDYIYEDHFVYTFSETRGILRQLDIEFPTSMKNKKVLARIQEQLFDTLFHKHYHTTHLDTAMSIYWPLKPE